MGELGSKPEMAIRVAGLEQDGAARAFPHRVAGITVMGEDTLRHIAQVLATLAHKQLFKNAVFRAEVMEDRAVRNT